MHVVVLGAGVIGITTAHFLVEAGAKVTVVERRPGPAQETSAANGGHLSASQARPWATPSVPRQLVRWLGQAGAPLRLPLWRWDPGLWRWSLRYLSNCLPMRYRANTRALLTLAHYSHIMLQELVARSGIAFNHHPGGLLALYRSSASLERARAEIAALSGTGLVDDEVLGADECARIEPALQSARDRGLLTGGVFSPKGATGDAAQFSRALAEASGRRGVVFRYSTTVEGVECSGGRVTGVRTSAGVIGADTVVVALAMDSRSIAAAFGLSLPLYPVKGYSITVPIDSSEARLPHIGILDDDRKVVFARFGAEFRAAGTAEFAGFDMRIDHRRIWPILAAAQELFPGPLDCSTGETSASWTGLRPMTPDGSPVLGPVPGAAGLFLNTGHGPLGWTLAAGSARAMVDVIQGRSPALDMAPYSAARFRAQ
ncbi:MAG: D-amino acid dehydrogenase [Alphaproteobacteria bacterium]|nr:D-amino acid dehydrogenase [Alphaproteobacteria bacterium]